MKFNVIDFDEILNPGPHLEKFLKEKGFHWNHSDGRGFSVYIRYNKNYEILSVMLPFSPRESLTVLKAGVPIVHTSREDFLENYDELMEGAGL